MTARHSPNSSPAHSGNNVVEDDESSVEIEKKIKATSSYKEKIKLLWKKYGIMFVASYFSVYFVTLTSVFVTLDFGLLNASSIGLEQAAVVSKVRLLIS